MTICKTLESLDDYCKPTNAQVEKNDATLMTPYDANTPIATLFERFDECLAVARENETSYTEEQLVHKFITGGVGTSISGPEELEKCRGILATEIPRPTEAPYRNNSGCGIPNTPVCELGGT